MCPNNGLDTWEESCRHEGPPTAQRQRILLARAGCMVHVSKQRFGHIRRILSARRASCRVAATDSSGWYWMKGKCVQTTVWTHGKNPVGPKGLLPRSGNGFFRLVLDVRQMRPSNGLDTWEESCRPEGPPAALRQRMLLASAGCMVHVSKQQFGHMERILSARRASCRVAATDSSS